MTMGFVLIIRARIGSLLVSDTEQATLLVYEHSQFQKVPLLCCIHCPFNIVSVRVAEEGAINIICSNDHDTSYSNLLSGVIKTHNMTSDRDCTMMLAFNGSVTIDIFVDELSMSSNDCDEEYFYIADDLGKKVVNTTLCYTASAGDVVQTQVVKPTPGEPHHVTFRLRLEKDSDLPLTQRSLISLHFIGKLEFIFFGIFPYHTPTNL